MYNSKVMTTVLISVLCLVSNVIAAPMPLANLFERQSLNTTIPSVPLYGNRTIPGARPFANKPWNETATPPYQNTTWTPPPPPPATTPSWNATSGSGSGSGAGSGSGSGSGGYTWSNTTVSAPGPWMRNGTQTPTPTSSASASASATASSTNQPIKPSASGGSAFKPFEGAASSVRFAASAGGSWPLMLAVLGMMAMI